MDDQGPTLAAIKSLTIIGRLSDQERELLEAKRYHVECARQQGASWRMIGVALGTSTQAAWEKYRPVEAPRPLPGQGALPLSTDGHKPGYGNHSTIVEYTSCKDCHPAP